MYCSLKSRKNPSEVETHGVRTVLNRFPDCPSDMLVNVIDCGTSRYWTFDYVIHTTYRSSTVLGGLALTTDCLRSLEHHRHRCYSLFYTHTRDHSIVHYFVTPAIMTHTTCRSSTVIGGQALTTDCLRSLGHHRHQCDYLFHTHA